MENKTKFPPKADQPLAEKKYEISALLKEENNSDIKNILEKNSCKILEEKEIVKIRLAYSIAKESQAYLTVLRFETGPETIKKICAEIGLVKNTLRFFITKLACFGNNEEKREGNLEERKNKYVKRNIPKTFNPINKVLSNEDLEKKIEEIMK